MSRLDISRLVRNITCPNIQRSLVPDRKRRLVYNKNIADGLDKLMRNNNSSCPAKKVHKPSSNLYFPPVNLVIDKVSLFNLAEIIAFRRIDMFTNDLVKFMNA